VDAKASDRSNDGDAAAEDIDCDATTETETNVGASSTTRDSKTPGFDQQHSIAEFKSQHCFGGIAFTVRLWCASTSLYAVAITSAT
jgi:hypothetical protein